MVLPGRLSPGNIGGSIAQLGSGSFFICCMIYFFPVVCLKMNI